MRHDSVVPNDEDLATALASVASVLAAEPDVIRVLQRITLLAVETVEACQHADVMVFDRRGVATVPAASDWIGPRIVSIESELDEGPCLDAARKATVVTIPDHTTETRWGRFAGRTVEATPVRSSVGLHLTVGDRTYGAIDLYADRPHAFGDTDVATGALFAVHAAVSVAAARARDDFQAALQSRDVIGQAKGILMAREQIDSDAAFDILRTASQRMNAKLRDVAQRIVEESRQA